jgi:hypothetical protein
VTLRDIALSFIGVVGGYVLGILQSVAADQRERRKARNRVLYVLFQTYWEVRTSNPYEVIPLLVVAIKKRFVHPGTDVIVPKEATISLSAMLREMTNSDLSQLTKSFDDAVQALVPIDPLLAFRITGPRSVGLEGLVQDYYKRVSSRPELATELNLLSIVGAMEAHTLELALNKTCDQLGADIREIARSFWLPKRRLILRELNRQNTRLSEAEFERKFGREMDEMASKLKCAMMSTPVHPAPPTPTREG